MIVASIEQERLINSVGSLVAVSLENGIDTVGIVDSKTGKTWIRMSGSNLQEAFNKACEAIKNTNQPKTAAEDAEIASLETENKKLRDQITQLQSTSKSVSPKSGTPSLKIEAS